MTINAPTAARTAVRANVTAGAKPDVMQYLADKGNDSATRLELIAGQLWTSMDQRHIDHLKALLAAEATYMRSLGHDSEVTDVASGERGAISKATLDFPPIPGPFKG